MPTFPHPGAATPNPIFTPPSTTPQTGGQAQQASGSGSDWQHLLLRGAEFMIGGILIYAGIVGIIARTKAGKTAVNVVVGGASGGATSAVKARTRTQLTSRAAAGTGGNGG